MITADKIDEIALLLENMDEEQADKVLDQMGDKQPAVMGYVLSDDAEELGESESETLLYGAIVIWMAFEGAGKITAISEEQIDAAQDANWAKLDNRERGKEETLEDFVEPFFEGYGEADLLQFVVDLIDDDLDEEEDTDDDFDWGISEEAKVPMFVIFKSIIDAYTLAHA